MLNHAQRLLGGLLACAAAAAAFEHGQISTLNTDCQQRFDAVLAMYDSPFGTPEDGRDNCTDVIQTSLDDVAGANCPTQQVLLGCFQIHGPAWVDLAQTCYLFSPAPNCLQSGVTGADCQRPPVGSQYWLTSNALKWTQTGYDFGTGVVPNLGETWRNTLPQTQRRSRRALLQGEGEGSAVASGGSGGCFPNIYNAQDLQNWLDGSYEEPFYGGNSINPVGIIFWVVHGLGIIAMSAL